MTGIPAPRTARGWRDLDTGALLREQDAIRAERWSAQSEGGELA